MFCDQAYQHLAADDDDFHYTPGGRDNRRGNQRRRYDEPHRRYEEPADAKLRRMTLHIAASTKLPQDEAIEIAEYLRKHFDDEEARNGFYDAVLQLYVVKLHLLEFCADSLILA